MPLRLSTIQLALFCLLAMVCMPLPGTIALAQSDQTIPAAPAKPAAPSPEQAQKPSPAPAPSQAPSQVPAKEPEQPNGQAGAVAGNATADAAKQIAGWNEILDSFQQALDREGVSNQQLSKFSDEAIEISRQAASLINTLTPRVEEIRKQIDQLGPAPKEGEPPEADAVAAKRTTLQEALAVVDGPLREARLIMVRTDQINGAALTKRRDRFLRQLFEQTTSILDPDFWRDAVAGMPTSLHSLDLLVRDSTTVMVKNMKDRPGDTLALLVQIFAGLALVWYLRRFIRRHLGVLPAPSEEGGQIAATAGQLASHHLSDFLRNGILPALLLIFLARMLSDSGLVADRFDRFGRNVWVTLAVVFIGFSLLRVFLRPVNPHIRIAEISDETAQSVFSITTLGLMVAGVIHVLNVAAILLLAPFEISLMLSALFALVTIAATTWSLIAVERDQTDQKREKSDSLLLRWSNVRSLLWVAVIAGTGGLLFGYIGLAEFTAYQIIMALAVIAVIWLTMNWIDDVRQALMSPQNATTPAEHKLLRLSKSGRQVAIVGFGLLRLVIFAGAIVALLIPWGVRTADWLVLLNRAFFGFEVGDLTISVSSILLAIVLFITGAVVTRAIQHWVATQFLPTTKLDTGLRNSITTVLGYVGFVLAVVLAVSATGLDLSSIAIVVGALSVGIGLGLQGIVNNFVSGLILLAERPIKVGDWVITSSGEGMVRRISVRSTEIETFNQATVVVPNSTLISETVTNWTHRSKLGRSIISVGVSYSSDPEQVREILLKCAEEHPLVLKYPEPMVFFMDFGSDALIFDLRFWVSDILNGFGAKSDLRFAILAALREANIEIPFPQRDLHIRSGLEALHSSARTKPAKSSARKASRISRRAVEDGSE
ncbi:MAG: DUF3772 domain-containing protein [Salaquimonas sp.]|nr:DUF3772 domain-containing protein [Salaquimonas sp.]